MTISMSEIMTILNQIGQSGEVSSPEVIKADTQVRTGGGDAPPHWLRTAKRDKSIKREPKQS